MADEDLELDVGEGGAPKKSKKMLFIIIGVVLLVLIGAGAGAYFMGVFDDAPTEVVAEDGGDEEDGDVKADTEEEGEVLSDDAIYWPIEPPFVLNFEGKSKAKYMQVGLVAMARSQKSIDTMKKHMPAIRNELTFLLSSQKYVEMVTPEGKEQLREEIMETINSVIKQHGSGAGMQKIYFTSFVMQ